MIEAASLQTRMNQLVNAIHMIEDEEVINHKG
jgi:hypothetical protein